MVKELNEKERKEFVEKYFKQWGNDIWKVTCVEHDKTYEYLVNEHYIFVVNK